VGKGDVVAMEWPAFVALEFELSVSKQMVRLRGVIALVRCESRL
jgi:hypothetical protein